MSLQFSEEALEYAVRRTGDYVIGAGDTRYSGDHIDALCRAIARLRLRETSDGPTTPALVEKALTEWIERPTLTAAEEFVLATHEAGHAVVSMFCEHAPPVDRITIHSEMHWAFGYVKYTDPVHRYIQTVNYYLDQICVALGAREAERALLKDLSLGCVADLDAATTIARELVEAHGLVGNRRAIRRCRSSPARRRDLSAETLKMLDERIAAIIEEQRARAETIIRDNKATVEALRDLLIEKKTLDRAALAAFHESEVTRGTNAHRPSPRPDHRQAEYRREARL